MALSASLITSPIVILRGGRTLLNGEHRRLTFSGDVSSPVCSPDERWVAYTRASRQEQGIYRRLLSGAGSEQVLLHTSDPVIASAWSPDGKYLVFDRDTGAAHTSRDLWLLPIEGERVPRPARDQRG